MLIRNSTLARKLYWTDLVSSDAASTSQHEPLNPAYLLYYCRLPRFANQQKTTDRPRKAYRDFGLIMIGMKEASRSVLPLTWHL
jgi:hypothetical protein